MNEMILRKFISAVCCSCWFSSVLSTWFCWTERKKLSASSAAVGAGDGTIWIYLNLIHLNHLILLILFGLNVFHLNEMILRKFISAVSAGEKIFWENILRKYLHHLLVMSIPACMYNMHVMHALSKGPAGKPFSASQKDLLACDHIMREKILIVASLLIKFVMDFISLRFASLIKSFFFSFSSMRISAVAGKKRKRILKYPKKKRNTHDSG